MCDTKQHRKDFWQLNPTKRLKTERSMDTEFCGCNLSSFYFPPHCSLRLHLELYLRSQAPALVLTPSLHQQIGSFQLKEEATFFTKSCFGLFKGFLVNNKKKTALSCEFHTDIHSTVSERPSREPTLRQQATPPFGDNTHFWHTLQQAKKTPSTNSFLVYSLWQSFAVLSGQKQNKPWFDLLNAHMLKAIKRAHKCSSLDVWCLFTCTCNDWPHLDYLMLVTNNCI